MQSNDSGKPHKTILNPGYFNFCSQKAEQHESFLIKMYLLHDFYRFFYNGRECWASGRCLLVFIDVIGGGRGAVGVCKTLQHRLAKPHSDWLGVMRLVQSQSRSGCARPRRWHGGSQGKNPTYAPMTASLMGTTQSDHPVLKHGL